MSQIIIYTTPWCQYCKATKEYLKSKGFEWQEVDVAKDTAKAQEMIDKSGQLGVPVLDIDGKIVVGFDKQKINQYLGIN